MATGTDETDIEVPPMFGGDTPEITVAEIKGYLKAMLAVIQQDDEPPPHQRVKRRTALAPPISFGSGA